MFMKNILFTKLIYTALIFCLPFLILGCGGGAKKLTPAPIEIGHGVPGGEPYVEVVPVLKQLSKHGQMQRAEEYQNDEIAQNSARRVARKHKKITVKAGDSLVKIANRYGVDMDYLARINNISAPYDIHPGQTLRIR